MIAYIQGKLVQKEASHVIIETNGIGYFISISLQTYSQIPDKEHCKLLTYFQVKEDAQNLYGFFEASEKALFLQLIGINGVGANTALVILSSMSAQELRETILQEDAKTIQSVKGIGAKTAQRIILELKDKMQKMDQGGDTTNQFTAPSHNKVKNEALSALVTLGLAKPAAEKAIDKLIKNNPSIGLEEIIKGVLKSA